MNGGAAPSTGFRPGAVGVGILWGLGMLVFCAVINALAVSFGWSPSQATDTIILMGWQVLGAFVGGLMAGRRASTVGWLHGALAGAALVLSLAAVMGVVTAFPAMAVLLKMAGIGTGAGLLGGVMGVNAANR